MREAQLRETESGVVAESAGWFVMNLRDAAWHTAPNAPLGTWVSFEADGVPQQIGVGVHVLMPGESPGRYHSESDQEGFFVLSGECVLVVEGEERRLRQWDYFHCPPGTAHITVGASEEPCAIFMLGARTPGGLTGYVPDPVAEEHGASVSERTGTSKEAYADLDRTYTSVRAPWPP
jgi:uncharacterized cupin superfamily protein